MDRFGRKIVILSVAIPHILAWICVIFSNSVWLFYLSRVMYGIGEGCLFTAFPTYMGEILTPKVRGSWGVFISSSFYVGQLLINSVGGYFDIKTTGYILLTLPVLFLLTFSQMPESPYYLLMKKNYEGAGESLKKLRRKRNVEKELKQLSLDVERQTSETGRLKDLIFNQTNRKAILISIFIRGSQQYSGIPAFTAYTQFLFQEAGGKISARTSSIVYSSMLLVLSLFATQTVDRLGRRLSLILSCGFSALVLAAEATFFYLKDHTDVNTSPAQWFPVAGMAIFLITYSLGLSTLPTLMLGELFSTSIKAIGLSVVNVVYNIYLSTSTKLFHSLTANYGLFTPFIVFFVCTLASTVLSYFFVPETRGKTLEEIQQSLKSTKNKNVNET